MQTPVTQVSILFFNLLNLVLVIMFLITSLDKWVAFITLISLDMVNILTLQLEHLMSSSFSHSILLLFLIETILLLSVAPVALMLTSSIQQEWSGSDTALQHQDATVTELSPSTTSQLQLFRF